MYTYLINKADGTIALRARGPIVGVNPDQELLQSEKKLRPKDYFYDYKEEDFVEKVRVVPAQAKKKARDARKALSDSALRFATLLERQDEDTQELFLLLLDVPRGLLLSALESRDVSRPGRP